VHLSGTESWQLALTVNNASGTIWNRIVPVEPVDCPYLTELVAQSFERGLADLPAWGLHDERRWPELAFVVSSTLPSVLRVGLTAELWMPVGARYGWQFQLTYMQSAVQNVEYRRKVSQVAYIGTQLETGPTLDLPLGQQKLRAATRLTFGGAQAAGRNFEEGDTRDAEPRVSWMTELLWAPNDHIRFGPRLEVGVVKARFVSVSEKPLAYEIPARGGLVLELGGPLPRKTPGGDGSRPGGR
jgi:hypothetical protein